MECIAFFRLLRSKRAGGDNLSPGSCLSCLCDVWCTRDDYSRLALSHGPRRQRHGCLCKGPPIEAIAKRLQHASHSPQRRRARNGTVGGGSLFAWGSVAARQRHGILRACRLHRAYAESGKRASMMSCVCQGNERDVRFPPSGCLHRCFGAPPARKMACSGMRVVWGQGCALDETSGRGAWWRWPAPAPAWRSGTRRTLCRCGTIVFARRVGLWCLDTEPAT